MTKPRLTHLDPENRPQMVDVGGKPSTRRTARARAEVHLPDEIARRFDGRELQTAKGPVFYTASLAGIMAAKRTSDLIPLCHLLTLDRCTVDLRMEDGNRIGIEATVSTEGRTGVEMEALTAVSVAALAVYDMCKALGHGILIERVGLLEKTGGKADLHRPNLDQPLASSTE